MKFLKDGGIRLLDRYIEQVEHFRIPVIILILACTTFAAFYTAENIVVNTSTKDMLSPQLSWRMLDLEYEEHFPQFTDNILVVIEGEIPDQAIDAAGQIYQRLLDEAHLFKSIYYPRALSVFRESALLYLNTGELQDLTDSLAKIQPFLSRLTDDQSLRGLFAMLSEAIEAMEDGEDINIEPLVLELDAAIRAIQTGNSHYVSWQDLMFGENGTSDSTEVYREHIILQPHLDWSKFFPASDIIRKIREISEGPELAKIGASVRLTGGVVLSHEELSSVSQGTSIAFLLSLCMIIIIMFAGLRSVRLLVFTLITLFTGLVLTAAFATLTVKELNLISIAFAVLYIGLGVAFSIHYCLRYKELVAQDRTNRFAIKESSRNIGKSLFLCTVTTAAAFFAFIPTDYRGVAELGWISGSGMFINLFLTLTLLPALIGSMPLTPAKAHKKAVTFSVPWRLSVIPIKHYRTVQIACLLLAILFAAMIVNLRFDYNTLNLQDQDNESVQTYRDLLSDSDTSPWTGIVVSHSREDAVNTINRLEKLAVVDKIIWLEDFIPEDQAEKLLLIDDINLILLGAFFSEPEEETPVDTEAVFRSLVDFHGRHSDSRLLAESPVMAGFFYNLGLYLDYLSGLSGEKRKQSLEVLSANALFYLPGRLEALRESLNAERISLDNLPEELKDRWYSPSGHYLLTVYPAENLNDDAAMRRFVKELQQSEPRIIGPPVINIEASDAVITAFKQAFLYAFLAIGILLVILLPRKRDSFYVLIPLFFALLVTGGVSVILDIPLNFANIIALPLLLGIGVDSSIHMLHRFRTALPDHQNILATSTARAVVVSAITTIGSIGNLAFSPHDGTASMGKLLTTGLGITLVATLILLPAMLASHLPSDKERKTVR